MSPGALSLYAVALPGSRTALGEATLARVDQQGLAFFLREGCEVVGITAQGATIRRPSGVVQTFAKRSKAARAPRTVPIWELVP